MSRLYVENFGPIASGDIELKPLTILLGPNNSGKSYLAMLIHSLINVLSEESLGHKRFFRPTFSDDPGENSQEILDKIRPLLQEQLEALDEGGKRELPKKIINYLIKHKSEKSSKLLEQEFIRFYSCQSNDLIRLNKPSSSIKLYNESESFQFEIKKDKIRPGAKNNTKLDVFLRSGDSEGYSFSLSNYGYKPVSLTVPPNYIEKGEKRLNMTLWGLSNSVTAFIKHNTLGTIGFPSYYLPAARSGILQGLKALAASVVRSAPFSEFEGMEIPKLSGGVSDFISLLMEMDEREGPFFKMATKFESELLKGNLRLQTRDNLTIPEIMYHFKDIKIPLRRASSTISELAPLFLYLKYKVKEGDLLIIEEPEAHLHPENQRILAKLLVRLIRSGLRLVITTHSDFLIEQLSSYIVLNQVKDEQRRRSLEFDENDYLSADEVGAYAFKLDDKEDGYIVDTIEVTDEDGISPEEFLRVHEALYNESLKIHQTLEDESC